MQHGKDLRPGNESAARSAAVVFARMERKESCFQGPQGGGVAPDFSDGMIRVEQHVQVVMIGQAQQAHDLFRSVDEVRAKVAHRFEHNADLPARGILAQQVQAFGGPPELIAGWPAPFHDARMSVQGAGVGHGPALGGHVDLPLVPRQPPRPVCGIIGGKIARQRPRAPGTDHEIETQRCGAVPRQALIERHIVPHRQLEHLEAELLGLVEQVQLVIRPALGKKIAVGAVFHVYPQPGNQNSTRNPTAWQHGIAAGHRKVSAPAS